VKLAKRMKKNTIAVDIIAFGDLDDETTRKVHAFHDNIKGSADGSNLAIIPPGPNLLSDSIIATPILAGKGMGPNMGGGAGGDEGGAGGESYEFGVDPNADPELALALRMSMEEEERRKAREDREKAEAESKTNLASVPEEGGGGGGGGGSSGSGGGESKTADGADPDKMDTA